MRRTGIWLALLAMAACAGNVSASIVTVDGDWSDWFTYNGNVNNDNWEQGNYTDNVGSFRSQSSPEGPLPGTVQIQDFDIEEIFYFLEDSDPADPSSGGVLHIGMVTGFDPNGVTYGGTTYYSGDMFIGLGGGVGANDIAVGTGLEPGGRAGSAWFNTGSPNWETLDVTDIASSNPYRVDESEPGAQDISSNASVAWGGMGVHNFLEISLELDSGAFNAVTDEDNGGLGLHWTMLCGNDVINVQDNDPLAPVPEPATMVLLGMGVAGIALRSRRSQC